MGRKWFVIFGVFSASTALAQDPDLSVSVGARAWYTEWTTFSYFTDDSGKNNLALTQVSADDKLAVMSGWRTDRARRRRDSPIEKPWAPGLLHNPPAPDRERLHIS